MTKQKKAFVVLVIAILLLILELLPYGAVLDFANISPDLTVGYYEQPFSYFDPIVYGYGHFGPFITAILTCLLAIVSVIHVFVDNRATRMILPITSVLTFLVSLTPVLTGCYSPLGGVISVLLFVAFMISLKKEETI